VKRRGANDELSSGPSARRRLIVGSGAAVGLVAIGAASRAFGPKPHEAEARPGPDEVQPGEDLMREHGVLRRVLLIYAEVGRRLAAGTSFEAGALRESADIIRTFIEDYHERQEEDFLFPRFERAGKLVDLVIVLRAQHDLGRKVTQRIQAAAWQPTLLDPDGRQRLLADMAAFARMYEPHAAREDTVLFPALHEIVSRSELDALGEDFDRRERAAFGADGFERVVSRIEAIERTLGIEDLEQFTPKA
jgi:hemerythrin-like domain-containing protein